jgi:hypothetical protein
MKIFIYIKKVCGKRNMKLYRGLLTFGVSEEGQVTTSYAKIFCLSLYMVKTIK